MGSTLSRSPGAANTPGCRNCSFAQAPPVIFAATGICRLLNIDLFPGVLADVTDVKPAGAAIEGVPIWIPQPIKPDFRAGAGHANKRIIGRNAVSGVRWIDMHPEHFAKKCGLVLGVTARLDVAGRSRRRVGVLVVA